MELSIIIPSFNTQKVLGDCLNSIAKFTDSKETEIIVVDNGSIDGSKEFLEKLSREKEISAVLSDTNLGFSKAVNLGIKKSSGEYVLIFNSDIIVQANSISLLLNFAKNNSTVGIVGGRLLNTDKSPQPSVFHFPSIIGAVKEYWLGQKGEYEKYLPKENDPARVDAIVGAVMLVSRKVLNRVGFLDEKYFMYFEDLDLCRRTIKAGYHNYYLPKAEFIHYHGLSGKNISANTSMWLVESSKKYNGLTKYLLITLIIRISQIVKKLLSI
jgi:GT2 family glycosyltransferase